MGVGISGGGYTDTQTAPAPEFPEMRGMGCSGAGHRGGPSQRYARHGLKAVLVESIADKWFSDYLMCPDCGGELLFDGRAARCADCGFQRVDGALVDLRPLRPAPRQISLTVVPAVSPENRLNAIDTEQPNMSYDGPSPLRSSRGLMSEICRYLPEPGDVLDLGCGPRDQAIPLEYLGHRYVGIDRASSAADLLADAHALPFRSATFDCVLSYAVLEHLHNPIIRFWRFGRLSRC
ncbi:MAG: class I SAM-dependent methyltransferase [Gammaproteobacteria bacterium]|nr:class I SAM-dependent methyltransferase [Gammaproteobacteria bacterium]